MKKSAAAVALVLAAAPLLGACGGDADAGPVARSGDVAAAPTTQSRTASVDLERVAGVFGATGHRYVEFEETAQLATSSVTEVAVMGQVAGFEPGPKLYPDGGPASGATIVLQVAIAEVVAGAPSSPCAVSVVLHASAGQTADDLAQVMPAGTVLVLYLAASEDLPRGAPDGLMTPVSPQGFVVGAGDPAQDGIAYPLTREVAADESLVDQLPVGDPRVRPPGCAQSMGSSTAARNAS